MKTIICVAISIGILAGETRADDDDIPTPEGVCIRGARTFTCPDGTTIDACDDCGANSSSGSSDDDAEARGVAAILGFALGLAAFPFAPGVIIEFVAGKGDDVFGDKAAARQRWTSFASGRADTERLGKQVDDANAALDKDATLRDAMVSSVDEAKEPSKKFWWMDKPHLKPTLDFQCNQAGLLFPFTDPNVAIAGFANSDDMLAKCAGHFRSGEPATAAPGNGRCPASTYQCMHASSSGQPTCCPQGSPIFNVIDGSCYRDTDYRGSKNPDARRYLGGEQCPAASSP